MKRLECLKDTLINILEGQINSGDLAQVNTEELGEVVDMVKDLAEAMYYCSITEAMEENAHEQSHYERYYTPHYNYPRYFTEYNYPNYSSENNYPRYFTDIEMKRDMDRPYGRMYQTDRMEHYEPYESREDRSSRSKRRYMDAKEKHQSKEIQMKELENYLHELSDDISEMIKDASSEEKTLLQQKISTLANKIK